MTTAAATKYTAATSIKVLKGLEPVRERPSMYIGGVDEKGLHHLVWEIVDNSVDEYLNGYADTVEVTLHRSGDAITVADNGRGIPVDIHPEYNIPGLELILTTLHSGGKFDDGNSYFHSGGLHGVGSSVVNALSRKLVATIKRDGFEWQQTFARGKPTGALQQLNPSNRHGTTIRFEPDGDIFKTTQFDPALIRSRLDDMAYIHSGLKVLFVNEVTGEKHDLTHPGGIPDFLTHLVTAHGDPPVCDVPFTQARNNGEKMEIALQWTTGSDEHVRSYVNGIRTAAGGTHEDGLRSGIVAAIRGYIETHEVNVKGVTITAEDIREGVVGVLSVFVRKPMFQGQTKEKLNNPEMKATVNGWIRPALESWLNTNRTAAEAIVGHIIIAARARQARKDAENEVKRKSPTSRKLNLPGKLADCKSSDVAETELFIVEGQSAGGSAKQGRDNNTQAVLPLRGKVLNSEGLGLSKVLTNKELSDLVSAIGTGAGEKFNIAHLRYGKIILLMDADSDGNHITTLLLAFFFRHLPELVKRGHVYLAQPPLYRIDVGKETYWARDDAHKEEILAGLRANAVTKIGRFKGLGEMDAGELGERPLKVRKRTLLQVHIDSMLEADQVFVELLGKEVAQRYKFIMEQAVRAVAEELDV